MHRAQSLNIIPKTPRGRPTRAHTDLGLEPLPVLDSEPARAVEDCQLSHFNTGKHICNATNSSEVDRENYLISMVKPLVIYGACLNTIEQRLLEAAHHFNVKVTLVRKPGVLACTVGEYGAQRRKIHIADNGRRRTHLFGLLEVDDICRAVTHDEMRMADAVRAFQFMDKEQPLRHPFRHVLLAAALSTFVCYGMFYGNMREAVYTFGITLVLCALQHMVNIASVFTAECIEVLITIIVSLLAHDTNTNANIIIGILPGFIYMCSMMKINPNGIGAGYPGYLRALFAVCYAFALKFGLPIIVDFFLMLRLYGLVVLSRALYDRIMKKRTVVTVRRFNRKRRASAPACIMSEKCTI